MKKNKISISLFVEIMIFVIVVIVFNNQLFQWIKDGEIKNWQLFSQNVALGLNSDQVAEMEGKKNDKDLASYSLLRDQLMRSMELGNKEKIKWLYLMRVQNKKVIFTVDSIDEKDFGHSEPGDEYVNYPKEILDVVNDKKPKIANSYSDDWGSFFSIFVPIVDYNTGDLVGILGADIAKSDYNLLIAKKMILPITITFVAIWLLIVLIRQFNNQKILKENEVLFHVLTDGVLDAMIISNDSGKIVLWNNAAEKIFKFSKNEALNHEFFPMIIPKDELKDENNQQILNLLHHGKNLTESQVFELRLHDKFQVEFDAEIAISSVKLKSEWHLIAVIRDISENKKKNVEILRKNKEINDQSKAILNILEDVNQEKEKVREHAENLKKFEAAVNQSNEMTVFSDADGKVLWGNPAIEKMTGFSLDEVFNAKAGQLWGGLMEKEFYVKLWHRIKVEKKVFSDIIYNHRKNGEKFTSTITIYPLLDDRGEPNIFVATQRDITREVEVDRMKTDFISLASHQLRTPLSGMKWFLEMLIAGDMGKLNKEQAEAIENIDKSNERMISLVGSLLNISRIESGRIIVEPESTDFATLVKTVTDELKIKFDDKKQSLVVSVDKNSPKINIDPKLIRQVFLNLLTNANKYTPEKGEIIIFISQKDQDVLVQVSDDGYGIPEQEQRKIFEKFYRASNVVKQETDGTGLGLYLVKAIIESSNGKIWFKSKINQGTSFWFTLPLKGVKAKKGEVSLS